MPYKDPERRKQQARAYFRKRYANDPLFRKTIGERGRKQRSTPKYKEWKRKNQATWAKTQRGQAYNMQYQKAYRIDPTHKEEKRIYQMEWSPIWNKTMKGKENQKRKNESLLGRFRSYRYQAKKKNRAFELTFEQFREHAERPCFYCKREGKVGLDRMDSKRGYTENNVVPCCAMCNFIKQEYSVPEWIEQIERILKNKEEILLVYSFNQLK